MTRVEERVAVITEMLRRYAEASETMNKGDRGDGTAVTGMPRTWNRSYRNLERLLKQMREERKKQWWHLTERYLRCQERKVEVRVQKTIKGPVLRLPPHSELGAGAPEIKGSTATVKLIVWTPAVRKHVVDLGLLWLAREEHWPFGPDLPQEFLDKDQLERLAA